MPDPQYLSTDPNAGQSSGYMSTDPQAGSAPAAPAKAPTPFKLGDFVQFPLDVAKGVAEGMLSTARGAAGMVLPQGVQNLLSAGREKVGLPSISSLTTPADTTQRASKAAEQIGEFFVPELAAEKAIPAANLLVKMSTLMASNAALARAQGAGPIGTSVSGLLGAVGPAMRAGTVASAPAVAQKVETALMKPTLADVRSGFQVGNVFKYGVGGSLSDTFEKTGTQLQDLSTQLKAELAAHPGITVDLNDAADETANRLKASAAQQFGQNVAIKGAVNTLRNEIKQLSILGAIPKNGQADLATANDVKRAVGELGAWIHDPSGRVMGADEKALETVANTYYDVLKNRLEQASPTGAVKMLNQQMSDLIPIRNAVIRRIPVEARREVFGLGDLLAMTSGRVPVGLANRLFHSGEFANLLANRGAAVGRAAEVGTQGLAGLVPTVDTAATPTGQP